MKAMASRVRKRVAGNLDPREATSISRDKDQSGYQNCEFEWLPKVVIYDAADLRFTLALYGTSIPLSSELPEVAEWLEREKSKQTTRNFATSNGDNDLVFKLEASNQKDA